MKQMLYENLLELVYACRYKLARMHASKHTDTLSCTHARNLFMKQPHTPTYTHAYTHTHTHTHTLTHTRTHTHTHTLTLHIAV